MNAHKKVLIITYYWPPSGGSGVQRWLKMSKYLNKFGWEPVIYTAENGEAPVIDHSLEKDVPEGITVLKTPIWEPYNLYKKFTSRKKDERMGAGFLNEKKQKKGLAENLSIWIRGNWFIPDARKFWIKPSIKYLTKYLKENPVDAIISTGPPHSMHLIALGIKKKLGITWIADFRDPWTDIDFYDQLKLTKRSDSKHKRLEKEVLSTADTVVSVSWHWEKDLQKRGAKKSVVITNGYDPQDVQHVSTQLSDKFTIAHIGSMNKDRNPETLWKVLADICSEKPDFENNLEISFIGKTDHAVFESIDNNHLTKTVKRIDYLPHTEVINAMSKAQVLLLAINDTPNVAGVIPGKIFEYIAVRRPVLAIGPPEADSGKIITETGAGEICGFEDYDGIRSTVLQYYMYFLEGKLNVTTQEELIEKYSRKELAHAYADLLNNLT